MSSFERYQCVFCQPTSGGKNLAVIPLDDNAIICSMTKEFEKRLAENANQITINNSQECTDAEFSYILFLCKQGIPIGFGALDSFLSGPDLAKRVKLIEKAVLQDENLKRELIDTLSLDQSNDWSKEYYDILCKVAGINASLEKQE